MRRPRSITCRGPVVAVVLVVLVLVQVAQGFVPRPPLSNHHAPSPGARSNRHTTTQLALFKGVREFFKRRKGAGPTTPEDDALLSKRDRFRRVLPVPPEGDPRRRRYLLGVGSPHLPPTMDDLWAEAWPTAACRDMMERKDGGGAGPPQADTLVRRFGRNETIQTVLYKDSASWCPYCESVWMMLEEKQMPYKIKRVNLLAYGEKPDWIYQLSGTGLMPVLEVDGGDGPRVLRESVDICRFIDWWRGSEGSPAGQTPRRLWPDKNDPVHAEAEDLLNLERDLFRDWFVYLFEGPEERGLEEFKAMLQQVETALGKHPDSPWFLPGAEPSLVDIVFAPKVERMVASCLYWKGLALRDNATYPNLSKWLDALDRRPSFQAFKMDFYNLVNSLEPLFGRAYGLDTLEIKELQRKVDGLHPTVWRLPLSPDEAAREYLPPDAQPSETYARQAAAVRLVVNHKRVPRYMLRALGRPGPEYRSALADPYAEVDDWALPEVEAAYRYLVLTLLRGKAAVEGGLKADKATADRAYVGSAEEAAAARARIVACLEYLRARIGVPRDMTLPEARQVRGALSWLIDELR